MNELQIIRQSKKPYECGAEIKKSLRSKLIIL